VDRLMIGISRRLPDVTQRDPNHPIVVRLLVRFPDLTARERLAKAGIESSVGSVGDSYDNALAETMIGLFKTEVIHRRGPWRSFDAVEYATLEWVDWFNNRRLLEPIGNILRQPRRKRTTTRPLRSPGWPHGSQPK
jgi:transposase InsO family protein